jgi:hypothetical protein
MQRPPGSEIALHEFTPVPLDELIERIQHLWTAATADEPPDCTCSYCGVPRATVELPDDVHELARLAAEYARSRKELDHLYREAVAKLSETREWSPGDIAYRGPQGVLRWIGPSKRASFDSKTHAQEQPECHALYTRVTDSGGYWRYEEARDEETA